MTVAAQPPIRHDWSQDEVRALFELPFNELLFRAQTVHRQYFNPNEVQISTLLSIKTGACPEDCAYCPQSAHHGTDLEKEKLMAVAKVVEEAKAAKARGATRFCMGAAWRNPHERDMPYVLEMVGQVKALGMETCMTLGMLSQSQAQALANAGLDYYNHNLDTSESFYGKIITTRTYSDRLQTLAHVRDGGMKVCCGGIMGLAETLYDRVGLLVQLANPSDQLESVPDDMLVTVTVIRLVSLHKLDTFEFILTIAVPLIMLPALLVGLSAGAAGMLEQIQALCFF